MRSYEKRTGRFENKSNKNSKNKKRSHTHTKKNLVTGMKLNEQVKTDQTQLKKK